MSSASDKCSTSVEFIRDFTEHLERDDPAHALNLVKDETSSRLVAECSWDIVPIVSSRLTTHNAKFNRQMYECCLEILNVIAEKCNPSESILEFLEQMECSEDDVKFCSLLRPLGSSLLKAKNKVKATEWCIATIKSYIQGLPPLDNVQEDPSVGRIMEVCEAVTFFIEPLIKEVSLSTNQQDKTLRSCLGCFLIYLLEAPLCFVHEETSETTSNGQYLPERIIMQICHLTGDLLRFIDVLNDDRIKRHETKLNDEECTEDLQMTTNVSRSEPPCLPYANFYFHVITRMSLWMKVPQVYDTRYILQSSLSRIKCFLENKDCRMLSRGLIFMHEVLQRVEKGRVEPEVLQLCIYADVLDDIVRVMIYCDSNSTRKKALRIFHMYVEAFNMEGRRLLLMRLYDVGGPSGFLSLITGIFKSCLTECLEFDPPCPHFLGNNMKCLLKKACRLPHGAGSDLVEISDEVITALNLLRYLTIRDRHNKTGIWDLIDELQQDYLIPLREGLDLCKAHWRMKANDLKERERQLGKTKRNLQLDKDVTITVGDEQLPAMPVREKIEFCNKALTGLDVMESLLVRVNECIIGDSTKRSDPVVTNL